MSDVLNPAKDEILTLIEATWPDTSKTIRTSQGSWLNWRDRIVALEIAPPFNVVNFGEARPYEGAPATMKLRRFEVRVYYVRRAPLDAAEEAAWDKKVERFVDAKGQALADALLAAMKTNSATYWQLAEDGEPVVDSSYQAACNHSFMVNSDSFYGCEVTFAVLAGESY